jgi:hypothetical protein
VPLTSPPKGLLMAAGAIFSAQGLAAFSNRIADQFVDLREF